MAERETSRTAQIAAVIVVTVAGALLAGGAFTATVFAIPGQPELVRAALGVLVAIVVGVKGQPLSDWLGQKTEVFVDGV